MKETSAQATSTRKRDPKQERSKQMVAKIRAATERIIVTKGLGAVTTNRIAEFAEISVGSIYQYYPNKQAILSEVEKAFFRDILEHLIAQMDRQSELVPARRVIYDLLYAFTSYVLEREVLYTGLSEVARKRDTESLFETALMNAGWAFVNGLGVKFKHKHPEESQRIVITSLSHLVSRYVVEAESRIPLDRFVDLITDLTFDFLFVEQV